MSFGSLKPASEVILMVKTGLVESGAQGANEGLITYLEPWKELLWECEMSQFVKLKG